MSDQSNGGTGDRKPRSPNGELRQLMEKSLAENRKLRQAVVDLATSGRKHVTPADFADMVTSDAWAELDVSALHARADELEQQRAQSSRDMLRNALLDAGVAPDGVDDALARLVAGGGGVDPAVAAAPETPQARTASLGDIAARPARLGGADYGEVLGEDRGLWGKDLIEVALLSELGNKRSS